ncbi:YrzI family small protein [Bacillus suaedae]|uniref:YrzI family small protein n=1 Tax=Halalkalibacter suaedae TaxID=2822140 RepID=A0A940WTE2_9BACI|nr:YrzI family small protein [Bacillus suaedae]MBP3951428.1 YrzI family small protein [Bacillus suaedae]
MTFSFLLFTVSIKKRYLSGPELEEVIRQKKYEREVQQHLTRYYR